MGILDLLKGIKKESGLLPDQQDTAAEMQEASPKPKIGEAQIKQAADILQKYKAGKANLEKRIIDNEQWFKMRHWEQIRKANTADPEPASGWLFNSIMNKHADAMDNYPEPNVLPREAADKTDAKTLSSILPVILEQRQFEQVYSDCWWYKLKTGTGVYGVFWNKNLENGLGDIDIRQLDLLNLFWEPGIRDIQRSRNLFHVDLIDTDILEAQYPETKGKIKASTVQVAKYLYDDTVNTDGKATVVDWYYKQTINGREVVQYCKFAGDMVLYASENDQAFAERGFYDHGQYPFVFDTLFLEEGTPAGFGYIDVMKDCQMYIDKLNQIIMKNAYMSGNPRWLVSQSADLNPEEFSDWSKQMITTNGRLDDTTFRQLQVQPLSSFIVNHLERKIDELKETSGNRDFSQGGTTGGVTAASAIAALQEAGSKPSRDMIKSSYRAFVKICYFIIELIRQFYDEPRCFRITGEAGETEFIDYSNAGIKEQPQEPEFGVDMGSRRPVFDIKVTSQRSSPFSKIAQNELAKEMYGAGFFNPQLTDQALIAMDMMEFEGKDAVVQKVTRLGTMQQTIMQMQEQMAKMMMIIERDYGVGLSMGEGQTEAAPMPRTMENTETVGTNPLGDAYRSGAGNTADTAREKAMTVAEPK